MKLDTDRIVGVAACGGVAVVVMAVSAALSSAPVLGVADRTWVLTASTAFVALGVLSWLSVRGFRALAIVVGLAHCWLGDYLGPLNFTLGGVAFLAGHLWFAAGFLAAGQEARRAWAAGGILVISSACIGVWLWPHLGGSDAPLVLSYMAVISLMVATAAGTRSGDWRTALVGAGLFYVSDIVVADWRYVHSAWPHERLCYPLYYGACVLLALWPLAAADGAGYGGGGLE